MTQPIEKATEPPLREHLTYVLSRINARLTAQATRLLKKHSVLTLVQWRLLIFVHSNGPSTLADFIRFSSFDKGQMSRVAGELVARGLLRSEPSPHDQRAHILSITEAGTAAYWQAQPHMHARRRHLLKSLTATEKAQLRTLLDKIEKAAETYEAKI